MKYNRYIQSLLSLCVMSAFCLSACSDDDIDKIAISGDEIRFCTSGWMSLGNSRSTQLYQQNSDLLDLNNGGGNFTVSAYLSGTSKAYIDESRVKYFDYPSGSEWLFRDSNDHAVTYFWPNFDNLDFFAYMPNSKYDGIDGYQSKPTYTTIGSYSYEDGPTFSCSLPAKVDLDTKMQEFIYAYSTNNKKTSNPVELQFKHPYAMIDFKLGLSYPSGNALTRLTLDSIQMANIYLDGIFSTKTGEWTPSGEKKMYTMRCGLEVPIQINLNSEFFRDLMVMPQKLDENIVLKFFIHDTLNDIDKVITATLPNKEWLPGRKYMYKIFIYKYSNTGKLELT